MQRLFLLFLCGMIGICTGCNILHFTHPMPRVGMTVDSLPAFLEGNYVLETENGSEFMEIHLPTDQACEVFSSGGVSKDSLDDYLAEFERLGFWIDKERNGDRTISTYDGHSLTRLRKVGEYYLLPNTLEYEIYLTQGCREGMIKLDQEGEYQMTRLRFAKGHYFLNIYEDGLWFTVILKETKEGLKIYKPEIKNKELLEIDGRYANLNQLQRQADNDWMAYPSDEDLLQMLESDDLFVSENWQRISTDQTFNVGLLSLCIFLAVSFIMLAWDLMRKRN
ncbi:MAG: hypothetical protein AAF388_13670 [Bacteroidota bacterium]